jgi:RNA polymerase sigma-70 factor (ECF subfamily)
MIEQHTTLAAQRADGHAGLQATQFLSSIDDAGSPRAFALASPPSAPRIAHRVSARASHDTGKPAAARRGPRYFEDLMQAAQEGDNRAYERLLRDIVPLLQAAARRRQQSLQAADLDDLVQETLLSVHSARATYDPRRPLLPWLFAILDRRWIDTTRRRTKRSQNEVQEEESDLATVADENSSMTEGYRDPQLLLQAIGSLPPRQQGVIELLKLREMTLEEVSAASGISVNAVKVAMHRALISLRKELGVSRAAA